MYIGNEEILSDALWGLKYLTDSEDILILCSSVICSQETVVQILIHAQNKNTQISNPARHILSNICLAKDEYGEILTANGALDVLKLLLTDKLNTADIIREVCWVLSNLVACGQLIISEFLALKLNIVVSEIIMNEGNISIVKECFWILSNSMIKGGNKQILEMTNDGIFTVFCKLLNIEDGHLRFLILETVKKTLDKFKVQKSDEDIDVIKENIVKSINASGCLDKINELNIGKNDKICELTKQIISLLENLQISSNIEYEMFYDN